MGKKHIIIIMSGKGNFNVSVLVPQNEFLRLTKKTGATLHDDDDDGGGEREEQEMEIDEDEEEERRHHHPLPRIAPRRRDLPFFANLAAAGLVPAAAAAGFGPGEGAAAAAAQAPPIEHDFPFEIRGLIKDLLDLIKDSSNRMIDWNPKTREVIFSGTTIPNSNISNIMLLLFGRKDPPKKKELLVSPDAFPPEAVGWRKANVLLGAPEVGYVIESILKDEDRAKENYPGLKWGVVTALSAAWSVIDDYKIEQIVKREEEKERQEEKRRKKMEKIEKEQAKQQEVEREASELKKIQEAAMAMKPIPSEQELALKYLTPIPESSKGARPKVKKPKEAAAASPTKKNKKKEEEAAASPTKKNKKEEAAAAAPKKEKLDQAVDEAIQEVGATKRAGQKPILVANKDGVPREKTRSQTAKALAEQKLREEPEEEELDYDENLFEDDDDEVYIIENN